MLALSITASMSGAGSAFVHDDDAGTVSTPTGRNPGYCPCPSGWVTVSAPLSVFMFDPRDVIAYSRFFMFGPWCRGESALTMASADVWWPIPSPLDAGSTWQTTRPPRVRRATFSLMPVGYTSWRSVQVPGFDDFCHLTPP